MKIVVDSTCAVAGGAITHLRHILPEMMKARSEDQLVVIGTEGTRRTLDLPCDIDWVPVPEIEHGLAGRMAFENLRLPRIVDSLGADVLFHPSNFSAFRVKCPQVILVHNLAPFLDDVISSESASQKLRLSVLRRLTRWSLRSASATIFISAWGRRLVLGREHAPANMPVIPFGAAHGASASVDLEALGRFGLEPDEFVLSVSHLYRYKKVEKLLDAWIDLGDEVAAWPLVVAGAPYDAPYASQLVDRAAAANSNVVFTGALDARSLAAMMAHCRAFAFPSEAENLPITLLEAMAAGCAIVTNQTCSMPETCADAALYADPPDADQYRLKLQQLLFDGHLREDLRIRARARSKYFDWTEAAVRTLDVLRGVARDARK